MSKYVSTREKSKLAAYEDEKSIFERRMKEKKDEVVDEVVLEERLIDEEFIQEELIPEAKEEKQPPTVKKRRTKKDPKKWTDLEEEILLRTVREFREKGLTDKAAFEDYANKSGRTFKSVSMRYFTKLSDRTESKRPPRRNSSWTKEEEELLLSEMKLGKANGKRTSDVIREFAEVMGKTYGNVHNCYYRIKQ